MTSRTGAILGVHVWGRACDIEALEELADGHGLPLLFDAAPAFDCTYRGRKLGNFGLAETNDDIDGVCEVIRSAFEHCEELASILDVSLSRR